MASCSVPGCGSHQQKLSVTDKFKVSFHELPSKELIRSQWIKNISRKNWEPKSRSRICSIHFRPDDFKVTQIRRVLKPEAVPTIFPSYPSYMQPKIVKPRKSHTKRILNNSLKRKPVAKIVNTLPAKQQKNKNTQLNLSTNLITDVSTVPEKQNISNENDKNTQLNLSTNLTDDISTTIPQKQHINNENDKNSQLNLSTNLAADILTTIPENQNISNEKLFNYHQTKLPITNDENTQLNTSTNLTDISTTVPVKQNISNENIPNRGRPLIPVSQLRKDRRRLQVENSKLKRINKSLKEKITALEKELEKIYKTSQVRWSDE